MCIRDSDNLSVGTVESSHNEFKKTEVNPINSPIVEGLAKRTEERKIKLKEFNYKFVKTRKVEDMEKEPAYKRAGIELSDNIENTITEKRKNTNKENLEVVKFLFSSKLSSSSTTTLRFS